MKIREILLETNERDVSAYYYVTANIVMKVEVLTKGKPDSLTETHARSLVKNKLEDMDDVTEVRIVDSSLV